jgi:hypothetical protein
LEQFTDGFVPLDGTLYGTADRQFCAVRRTAVWNIQQMGLCFLCSQWPSSDCSSHHILRPVAPPPPPSLATTPITLTPVTCTFICSTLGTDCLSSLVRIPDHLSALAACFVCLSVCLFLKQGVLWPSYKWPFCSGLAAMLQLCTSGRLAGWSECER